MTALSCLVMFMSACSTNPFGQEPSISRGQIGYVSGALGVLATDEPKAALIGRDILSAGGTATDAAVAMGFALSVTMPSSASLGGGGVCIARNAGEVAPEVIDFMPRASVLAGSGVARPSAVPLMPRGLFLLHSKYGKLKWEQVVIPAENLARFGFQVPRAFASELRRVSDALLRDPVASRIFRKRDGTVIGEGDFLTQPDLAATIGRIRQKGVGSFYAGSFGHELSKAFAEAGGSLDPQELREAQPIVRAPLTFGWERNTVWHFAGPPAAGGAVSAEMMAIMLDEFLFEDSEGVTREHVLVEAAKRAFANRMNNMRTDGTYGQSAQQFVNKDYVDDVEDSIDKSRATPFSSLISEPKDWPETPSAVSVAVMDTAGGAAACTFTLNNVFGTGRMAPGFGIVLAAAPDARGRTFTPLGPGLLTSEFFKNAYMAFASSGGVTAPTALANVMIRAAAGPQSLRESMSAPRTHYGGVPDKVFVEQTMPEETVQQLRQLGHDVALTKSIGRVVAVYCPTGLPAKDNPSCESATDPRGFGIALGGN